MFEKIKQLFANNYTSLNVISRRMKSFKEQYSVKIRNYYFLKRFKSDKHANYNH